MAYVLGNHQSWAIWIDLPAPFVVKVTDALGDPVEGYRVGWFFVSVPPGATGHRLSVETTYTDENGLATAWLTLGDQTGTYEVWASAWGLWGVVRSSFWQREPRKRACRARWISLQGNPGEAEISMARSGEVAQRASSVQEDVGEPASSA